STNTYELTGGHDVDQGWIKDIRVQVDGQRRGKVVPRFQFQNWNQMDYQMLVNELSEVNSLVDTLSFECRNQGFDGLVLEASYPVLLRNLIMRLGTKLHNQSQEFILVLPPRKTSIPHFTAAQFEDFSQFVDGPNAPIDWVEDNILSFTPTSMNR
ncbi:9661_t:CDS:2, partial [Scutellospora calospora]